MKILHGGIAATLDYTVYYYCFIACNNSHITRTIQKYHFNCKIFYLAQLDMSHGDKHNETKVPDELLTEKARLDIEELKGRITDQKKIKIWENYVKPIIPVGVTLIIGIWGSILTSNYNSAQLENIKRKNFSDSSVAQTQLKIAQTQLDIAIDKNLADKELAQTQFDISKQKNETDKQIALTQLEVSKNKNESDKTIAQITASLSFVKLLQDISTSNPDLTHQAKTVIAPALPPETSFNIAIAELPDNPNALEVLLRTFKEGSWKYLTPFVEYSTETKSYLFDFLSKRLLIEAFYKFLISANYRSPNRIHSLINYYNYIYKREELAHNPSKSNALFYEISAIINKTSDCELKHDISGASLIAFGEPYSAFAAKYYWEKYDISVGQTPLDNSIDEFIYGRFDETSKQILSNGLFSKLSKLNYTRFDVHRIEVICYSYCESQPRGNQKIFSAFLQPNQSYELIAKVLMALDNTARKKVFSDHLGSLSGDILFKNISQDKMIGKKYAELLISWYRANWKKDWGIPKFFSSVIVEYPELKTKMDKKWGIWIE